MTKTQDAEIEIFSQAVADFITRDIVAVPARAGEDAEAAKLREARRSVRVVEFAALVAPLAKVAAEAIFASKGE